MLSLDHVGFFIMIKLWNSTFLINNRESPHCIATCHKIPIIRNSLRTTGLPHKEPDYQLQSNYDEKTEAAPYVIVVSDNQYLFAVHSSHAVVER